jgi:hypothetical protein
MGDVISCHRHESQASTVLAMAQARTDGSAQTASHDMTPKSHLVWKLTIGGVASH